MEEKELFRIKKWHRGLACMLVISLTLMAFTQFYGTHTGETVRVDLQEAGMASETEPQAFFTESPEESLLYQTAQELTEYSRILEQESGENQSAGLEELEEKLEEYQQQVEVWNQETEEWLEESGSEILLARQKEFEAEMEEGFAQLTEQLQQAKAEGSSDAVVQTIQTLLNGETQEYTPIYGSSLPNEVEAGEEAFEEADEAEIHEERAVYEAVPARSTEAELSTEGLTALSEEMMQKAEELETPLQIYLYLKNHIHSELYYGSRKGAVAVWDSLAGNDKDQASLLIAMLRYQGYPARYAKGRIYLNAEQVMNLTGTEDVRQAAEVLVKLGTPVTLVAGKDGPIGIKMEHTWVEAYLPYGDYRGAGNHSGESMWIPLDTFIKTYEDADSVFCHLEEIGLTDESIEQMAEAYGTEYLDQVMAQWEEPLNQLLEENPDLTLLNRKVIPEELSYLPMSLQYSVVERQDTCAALPANECDRITFALNGETLATLTAAELYTHRLTIAYLPAEEEDRAVLEQYGSVFEAPSHLLRLRGTLLLDGEAIACGEPLAPGSVETFTMDVYSGIQSDHIENQLMAGGMYQITLDMQIMTEEELTEALAELEQASEELNASESRNIGEVYTDAKMGRLLDCAGKYYFARVDIADRILAEYMGINATRTLSVGMTGYTVTPVVMMGRVVGLEEGSLYIDVDLDSHGVVSLTGDKEAEQRYMLTTGMLSSAYEGAIWEELLGVEAVSTAAVLQQACEEGIEIYALCSKNYGEYRSKLHVKENVLAAVDSAIASGMIVTIPAEMIQMGDWTGTGYMVTNPDTMATAYMISGGLNGGFCQEMVEVAFIGNALLSMLDIALGCAGIIGIISLLSMATPIGIILGAGLAILTIVAMHMANAALEENFRQMEAYINGEISGDEIVYGFLWNVALTVATFGLSKGIEKGVAYAAERYLTKIVGARLAEGLLSEGVSPTGLVRAVKQMKNLGYTDDFIRELADNISAQQLIRMSRLSRKGLSTEVLDIFLLHSKQLGNYSDDLIWQMDRMGSYVDDILKLVDDYGEAFTRQIGADDLSRLGRLVNEGLSDDVVDALIWHVDYFADYSDDAIKKIAESGCNAERILTQIDSYAKDFTEDLTAGQLKRLDDILEQGITQEQFEVLLKHGNQLDDYTDEVITLWKDYAGNGDDFLNLVDDFGEVFVKGYQKVENKAEIVNLFEEALANGYVPVRLNTDNIRILNEGDDAIIAAVLELKRKIPSSLRNDGNFAYAQVIINGEEKVFYASSAINSLDQSPVLVDRLPDISVKPEVIYYSARDGINVEGKIFLRDSCTEYKIFNDIASELQPGASGKVTLFTELKPCDSCKDIINHFMEDFPDIEIEIIHNDGGRIK
ncbi:MAG: hypothetical protein K2N24_01405 [Lachnospiraceae bacterium]|nr:hypothetical protein [Lachnospiraceae bacterium]